MNEVIVVGGGASGIIAAVTASEKGAAVTVLEKEKTPMKKLARTGNGKCNISNMSIDGSTFLSHDPARAFSIYSQFDTTKTFAFFEKLGIPVISKSGNELYPACESAASVVKIFKLEAESRGIRIKNTEYVREIEKSGSRFTVCTDTWKYEADRVIIACGTNASTGSGDTLVSEKIAEKFDLKFYEYLPALTRLYSKGDYLKKWAGTRVFGVIKLYVDSICAAEDYGELQLTDCGISGIPVFNISRFVNVILAEGRHRVELELDFFPDVEENELAAMIRKLIRRKDIRRDIRQAFLGFLPEKLINAVIKENDTAEEAVNRVKRFRIPITSLSKISESQVCSGGISLNEINDRMECIKVPGLFFCGEALDADAACGGFNLQWAWSTGALAGNAAADEL